MATVARRYASPQGRFDRPSARRGAQAAGPVVLMVSGGADSTALLLLAATSSLDVCDGRGEARIARERLHVLHVNHMLRGMDAEEDEEFVRGLAGRHGIPCTVVRADVAAMAEGRPDGNVENVGREVRYAAAGRLANELCEAVGVSRSSARILTAHTADDRAETFLMNAVRGSGASGLSSIPRRRNRIVRPLLDRTHDELCDLLRMRGIVWREDDTNADTRYLRAFVRHEVLPVLRERNPHVVESVSSTCDILSDEDAYLAGVAARALRDLQRRSSRGMLALDASRLAALDVAVARRVVRQAIIGVCPDCRLESRHVNRVLGLVAVGSGSAQVPMGVDCRVEYGMLFLRSREAAGDAGASATWLAVPGEVDVADGARISARLVSCDGGADPVRMARELGLGSEGGAVLLDAAACGLDRSGGCVWVDAPQVGEVMCPLGMHGQSKRLSDLLNEARVPAAERPSVPVVRTSAGGRVLWVAGIRADERARCTPSSRLLLELRFRNDCARP